jgi:hypothetical protein
LPKIQNCKVGFKIQEQCRLAWFSSRYVTLNRVLNV